MTKKYLLVIVGPTAVGKTTMSISLAKYFNTEIISADSRQFFREMNIGTAKPSSEEMGGVKHHFINSHSISEDYNVGKFETEALQKLEEIFNRKNSCILTGGSGLYIKAVCEGMDELPDAPEEIRKKLNEQYKSGGLPLLLEELKEKDPVFFKKVDQENPQRVLRALEVIRATGKAFSSFHTHRKKQRPFEIIKIGLDLDRKELYKNIDERVEQMIDSGLLEEVKALYPFKNKNALQTVGYEEVFDFMDGKYAEEEVIRLIKRNTRRYAKRQMTWFRKDEEITWFSPDGREKIIGWIEKKMED